MNKPLLARAFDVSINKGVSSALLVENRSPASQVLWGEVGRSGARGQLWDSRKLACHTSASSWLFREHPFYRWASVSPSVKRTVSEQLKGYRSQVGFKCLSMNLNNKNKNLLSAYP